MPVALHTDLLTLPRSQLDERFRRAIHEVEENQRGERRGWQKRHHHDVLTLESGVRFVPDGQDAKAGIAATIGGGIAAVFGAAFLGILAEGKQSEPWMRYAGPVLLATGAYAVWTGRANTRAAQAEPRLTGAYLFDDALLHVGTLGCQVFPRECIRGFSYRETTEHRWKLLVLYVADDGAQREEVLLYDDATTTLDEWLTPPS